MTSGHSGAWHSVGWALGQEYTLLEGHSGGVHSFAASEHSVYLPERETNGKSENVLQAKKEGGGGHYLRQFISEWIVCVAQINPNSQRLMKMPGKRNFHNFVNQVRRCPYLR